MQPTWAALICLQYPILDRWKLRYACFRFHAIVTRSSHPSFTQKSFLPTKQDLRVPRLLTGPTVSAAYQFSHSTLSQPAKPADRRWGLSPAKRRRDTVGNLTEPGLRARRISPSTGPKSRPPSSGLFLVRTGRSLDAARFVYGRHSIRDDLC